MILIALSEAFCNPPQLQQELNSLDQTDAINARYSEAATVQEKCLCSPVSFNKKYLEIIPKDIIEKDYGCGDPTCWVKEGETVLDLGSGSGKNAFICAQATGM